MIITKQTKKQAQRFAFFIWLQCSVPETTKCERNTVIFEKSPISCKKIKKYIK